MNWSFLNKGATQESAMPSVKEVVAMARKSASVQMALLVEMLRMLQEYEQCQNLPAVPQEPVMPEKLRQLEALGFTNTADWNDYKQQMERHQQQMKAYLNAVESRKNAREAVETLCYARQQFGKDALLIRFDDFERLMDKFNLVCGTFDSYTGDVPLEKIADISTLLEQSSGSRRPWFMTTLRPVVSYEIIRHFGDEVKIPSYLNRFPFAKDCFGYPKDFHGNKTWDYDLGYMLRFGKETHLFICAPAKDMKPLERIVSPRNVNDPFICAHTYHGILVFTRWGEESDDAIVKKYEQVNQILDNLLIGV